MVGGGPTGATCLENWPAALAGLLALLVATPTVAKIAVMATADKKAEANALLCLGNRVLFVIPKS